MKMNLKYCFVSYNFLYDKNVVVVVKLAVAAVFALQVARIRHLKCEQRKVGQSEADVVGGEVFFHCLIGLRYSLLCG